MTSPLGFSNTGLSPNAGLSPSTGRPSDTGGSPNRGISPLRAAGLARAVVGTVVVTGVLVVHDGEAWLKECLDGLSLQTRPLDRLVIVDTGSVDDSPRIAAKHIRIRQVVGEVMAISLPTESTFGEAVGRAVGQLPLGLGSALGWVSGSDPALGSEAAPVAKAADSDPRDEWLWLLHDDSAAAPEVLAHLLDAARRSPSVGIAGPKLITWDDPCRLLEVGSVITRSGRRVGGPARGERDQGQHDHRSDVLGVCTSGMLIRRDVFDTLGGFDPAFGQFRDGLDLCWRAQLAGHRVVVVPRARMREAAASTNGQRSPALTADVARSRDRRQGAQVALARCSPYAAPALALWIALASIGSAVVLLLAKRPRRAWVALGDLGSLMTPWRPMAARWRSRGICRVRRRDLRALFASPRAALGYALDTIQEGVAPQGRGSGPSRSRDDDAGDGRSVESGPASEDAESLERPDRGVGQRIVGHPGFLAVMAAILFAAGMWRSMLGALNPGGPGLAGGELLPVSGGSSELWHAWLDGWHGAGLGNALEPAPYLLVLSAGSWVLEHLPLIGVPTSSVAALIAWLLAAAIPASAWTAYLGARVVTRAPWPRAWGALAWASLATLTTAVAGGRLGAVVAHILLPLVAAGFVHAARGSARYSTTFGAAVALAVTGAFNPALAVVGALAALVLFVLGHGWTRLRAAVLLLVPIGLLGPWILRLVDNPLLALTGPGLTVWRGAPAAPWQLELLHPGGPGSYPVLLSAPIVLAGVVAMTRREAGSRTMTILAVLTLTGLAMAVVSPHLIVGRVPPELAGSGGPITVWAGTGLDLAALALIAAALRAFGRGRLLSASRLRWRRILVRSLATAAVLALVASMALAGRLGFGDELTSQVPDLPAVAADQASGSLGTRLLAVSKDGDTIGYRLLGAEPGQLVRDLPRAAVAPDPLLAAAVRTMVGNNELMPAKAAHDGLAGLGVGFVAFHGTSTEPLVNELDATSGMARLSNNHRLVLWRVLPSENAVRSSRLRLVDSRGGALASIAVTGSHGRTDTAVGEATPRMVAPGLVDSGSATSGSPTSGSATSGSATSGSARSGSARSGSAAEGRRLVVAEPNLWAQHARVTFAGRSLAAIAGAPQPTYLLPPTAGHLSITLPPTYPWWRWGQLGLLLVVLFLAAPIGSTRRRRTP